MLRLFSIDEHYEWSLEKGSYLIGRGNDCDFRIADNTVSRQHAKITIDEGEIVTVEDLDSHNGTSVNGEKIQKMAIIKANDNIQFGHVDFMLARGDHKPVLESRAVLQDDDLDLSHATMYPLQTALRPLPSRLLDNPRIFSIFSEMGKMLVVPGLGTEMYDRALALLSEIIPAERLALFFMADDLNEVNLAAQRFSKGRNPGKFVLSRTIIKHIAAEKNAVIIVNLGRPAVA